MQKNTESKKVFLKILTVQKAEGQSESEQLELAGEMFQKASSVHLLYQEKRTKTHIRISGKTVHVHRLGELSGDLWFVEGDERDTRYETPYGRLVLTLNTNCVDWDAEANRLYIRYEILTAGQTVSRNELTIEIKEREEYEKSDR